MRPAVTRKLAILLVFSLPLVFFCKSKQTKKGATPTARKKTKAVQGKVEENKESINITARNVSANQKRDLVTKNDEVDAEKMRKLKEQDRLLAKQRKAAKKKKRKSTAAAAADADDEGDNETLTAMDGGSIGSAFGNKNAKKKKAKKAKAKKRKAAKKGAVAKAPAKGANIAKGSKKAAGKVAASGARANPGSNAKSTRAAASRTNGHGGPGTLAARKRDMNLIGKRELVFFPMGSARLDRISRKKLKSLDITPGSVVYIYGYSDDRGGRGYNTRLSKKRAQIVHSYLRRVQPKARFVVKGFGETKPRFSNKVAWGRRLNRRVFVEVK